MKHLLLLATFIFISGASFAQDAIEIRKEFAHGLINLPDSLQEKVADCLKLDFTDSNAFVQLSTYIDDAKALGLLKLENCVTSQVIK